MVQMELRLNDCYGQVTDNCDNTKADLELPPELWIEIFKFINPYEIYTTLKNVCWYWRNMILNNSVLPKISVDCDVYIVNDGFQRCSFTEIIENQLPTVELTDHYRFTIGQLSNSGLCIGKLRNSEFNVSKRRGEVVGEGRKDGAFYPIPFDCETTRQILSYFQVDSLRITVNKRKKDNGQRDDKLVEILHFLRTYCGGLQIRSLGLRSENAEKPWCLGLRSIHFLEQLKPLERLQICNIVELTDTALSAYETRDIELCFSSQKIYTVGVHVLIPPAQSFGSVLDSFIGKRINNQVFEFYIEKPNFVIAVAAEDICSFIQKWRTLEPLWVFKKISFNCRATCRELSNSVPHITIQSLNHERSSRPIFCYEHRSNKNYVLDISYDERQVSTLWTFQVLDAVNCSHVVHYSQWSKIL